MFTRKIVPWLAAGQLLGLAALATARPAAGANQQDIPQSETFRPAAVAEVLLNSLHPSALQELAAEVLERSPRIARAKQRAAAVAARAPQVRALPDPVASLRLFVLPPETRVGPQLLSVSLSQRFPWFGKLALAERAALLEATAVETKIEVVRLDLLLETRRLAYELAFLKAHRDAIEAERSALVRFEKAAQARYASGTGMQQEIVRIQAQITRVDTLRLEIAERRITLLSALNILRDRPANEPVELPPLPELSDVRFDLEVLRRIASENRPELAAIDSHIAAHATLEELALRQFRPDLTLGFSYTAVEGRGDTVGRSNPPEDNGDDILALTGSLNLPIRRGRLEAAVEEARAKRWAAEEEKRQVLAEIEGTLGDLAARIPLLHNHLQLLETVLLTQAREALRSAEIAYGTGKLSAVDLLDAEVVLFEVRIAAARTRADLTVALARLERAAGRPLTHLTGSSTP